MNEKLVQFFNKTKELTVHVYEESCEAMDLAKRRHNLKAKNKNYEKVISDLYQEIGKLCYENDLNSKDALDLNDLYAQITSNKEMLDFTSRQLEDLKKLSVEDEDMIDLDSPGNK